MKILLLRRWKLTLFAEQSGFPVYFARSIKKQIRERRMETISSDEFDCRTDQMDIVRGNILAKIDRTHRKIQLIQIDDSTRISLRLVKIGDTDSRRQQEFFDILHRGGLSHQEDSFYFTIKQSVSCIISLQVQEHRSATRYDAVGDEQGQSQRTRSAAFRAYRKPPAFKLRKEVQVCSASIENQNRSI